MLLLPRTIHTHTGSDGGRPTGLDSVEWAVRAVELGAGEIVVNSIDADGTQDGYNLDLTRAISQAVNVPVIASGGAGTLEHMYQVVAEGKADAVLAASIFHFGTFRIAQAKEYLAKYAADRVRNTSSIFLGVTMGCAECHNHKFDPFTTKDFYSLAAFFADIKEVGVGNAPAYPVATAAHQEKLKEIESQLAVLQKKLQQPTPQLQKARKVWEVKLAQQAKSSVQLAPWYQIGPFPIANFDEGHKKALATSPGTDPSITVVDSQDKEIGSLP